MNSQRLWQYARILFRIKQEQIPACGWIWGAKCNLNLSSGQLWNIGKENGFIFMFVIVSSECWPRYANRIPQLNTYPRLVGKHKWTWWAWKHRHNIVCRTAGVKVEGLGGEKMNNLKIKNILWISIYPPAPAYWITFKLKCLKCALWFLTSPK